MFLEKLNDSERQALADLMMILSKADQRLAVREMSYLKKISRKYNLILNDPPKANEEILCNAIFNDCTKIIILIELTHFARIDDEYDKSEKLFVEKICTLLGVSKAKLHEIDRWVKDKVEINKRGEKITACMDTI